MRDASPPKTRYFLSGILLSCLYNLGLFNPPGGDILILYGRAAFVVIALHQIRQGQMIHHAGDGGLDLLPHLHGDAAVGPAAAAGVVLIHTAHRGQVALQHPQDLPHGVLLRLPGQQVAAAGPPHRAHQARPGELGHDLLQVFIRDLLPLGHVPQGHRRAVAVQGDVQHQAQGVAALRGNFHAYPTFSDNIIP